MPLASTASLNIYNLYIYINLPFLYSNIMFIDLKSTIKRELTIEVTQAAQLVQLVLTTLVKV